MFPDGLDIADKLRKGNTHALQAIHCLFYPALRNFATNLLRDSQAAEDILTEVFVMLWQKHADFDSLSNIKAFLFISTRNACINYVKKQKRDSLWKDELSIYLSDDREEFVLNEMIRAEILQQIYEEVESLPAQCRMIFKMSFMEGFTNPQIAEKLNISLSTVKNHKVKALYLLRIRILGENFSCNTRV